MKATIEYDCSDYDEHQMLLKALKINDYHGALSEINEKLRMLSKHEEDEKTAEVFYHFRDTFFEILRDFEINL